MPRRTRAPRPIREEAALVELELATNAVLRGRYARARELIQKADQYLGELVAEERGAASGRGG